MASSENRGAEDSTKVPKGSSGETALVTCGTTVGPFTMKFVRDWSPHGYDKAVALFERGWYDGSPLFRVIQDWLVQFGISYTQDPDLLAFADILIQDDPNKNIPFEEGTISFAGWGTNSRDSQLFISYDTDPNLGKSPWETPLGMVVEGMENVRKFHAYGDPAPDGPGPNEDLILDRGPSYIETNFPKMANFQACTVRRSSYTSGGPYVNGVEQINDDDEVWWDDDGNYDDDVEWDDDDEVDESIEYSDEEELEDEDVLDGDEDDLDDDEYEENDDEYEEEEIEVDENGDDLGFDQEVEDNDEDEVGRRRLMMIETGVAGQLDWNAIGASRSGISPFALTAGTAFVCLMALVVLRKRLSSCSPNKY